MTDWNEISELHAALEARQNSYWTEAKYSTASFFEAAGIQKLDGRRWLDRGLLVAKSVAPNQKSKFRWSLEQVLSGAIANRLVTLGMHHPDAHTTGNTLAAAMVLFSGSINAFAGGMDFLANAWLDADGGIRVKVFHPLNPPQESPADAYFTINVSKIMAAIGPGLGLTFVTGNSDDFRAAADALASKGDGQ